MAKDIRRPIADQCGSSAHITNPRDGWVAFLDIYAFSSQLDNPSFSNTLERLNKYHVAVIACLSAIRQVKFILFSDTAVIWTRSKGVSASLERLLEACAATQQAAAAHKFLLRGALSWGALSTSANYVLGAPYLRSYKIESSVIVDPIVVVTVDELKKAGVFDTFSSQITCIRTKAGDECRCFVLPYVQWDLAHRIIDDNISALAKTDTPRKSEWIERWEMAREMHRYSGPLE